MPTFEETFNSSLEYFDGDELAASVFATKYALVDRNEEYKELTPEDMHRRLAAEFARIEKKYPNPLTEDQIFELFDRFKWVVPQGSPMSAIGNNFQIQSLSNCFVIRSPYDSYGGVLRTDQELVQIAKRRGGVGFDISTIRPKGLSTANAARTTDGIEVFMDRYSNSTREVAQGGRRGALMLTVSVHHPQIRDFIRIKQNRDRVTGANISIRLTDEFMNAVENGDTVQLRFPVDQKEDPLIGEYVDARDLWDEIVTSAHGYAEPGLLFWDTCKSLTPADIYEDEGFGSVSTNPCGEILLSPYDSCRLMLINFYSFVKNPFTAEASFDFDKLAAVAVKAQRLSDDLVDLEIEQVDKILNKIAADPEPHEVKSIERDMWTKIKYQATRGRRTGLGVTGVGDTVAALGIRYGSEESIELVEEMYRVMTVNAYKSSCIMARERGAFEIHDHNKEKGHPFLERIWEADAEVYDLSRRYGRRNIALTTTAPAGSVSTLTQTTSGIEPAYLLKYTRRRKITSGEKGVSVDYVDAMGDKWTEYDVYHHGFSKWMEVSGEDDIELSPYHEATSNDIDWVQKVKMQSAAQRWVCHAISNTTNVPNDATVDTVKKIYETGWSSGCKGVTVYREGSRDGVLISSDSEDEIRFEEHEAPDRPRELSCHIHQVTIKQDAWTILVGLLDGRPYEVMGGLSKFIEIPRKVKDGRLIKRPRKTMPSIYDLTFGQNGDEVKIKDVVAVFDNPDYSAFTRTISLALRHGAPIQFVVEQLQKDRDADLFSFSKVISRVLKNYIEDGSEPGARSCTECGSEGSLVYQEGCITCKSCGYSKCG